MKKTMKNLMAELLADYEDARDHGDLSSAASFGVAIERVVEYVVNRDLTGTDAEEVLEMAREIAK